MPPASLELRGSSSTRSARHSCPGVQPPTRRRPGRGRRASSSPAPGPDRDPRIERQREPERGVGMPIVPHAATLLRRRRHPRSRSVRARAARRERQQVALDLLLGDAVLARPAPAPPRPPSARPASASSILPAVGFRPWYLARLQVEHDRLGDEAAADRRAGACAPGRRADRCGGSRPRVIWIGVSLRSERCASQYSATVPVRWP